jgi:ribosome-associated heat shock protein Hsp15
MVPEVLGAEARKTSGTILIDSVENSSDPLRVDVWLDVVCLCKTRSEAQRACRGGKIDVNGQAAKPHRLVKAGDIVEITKPGGRRQKVIVRGTASKHLPKTEARLLYEDITPPPSPEEQALLDMMRLAGPRRAYGSHVTPDKREKRRLRRAKEHGH